MCLGNVPEAGDPGVGQPGGQPSQMAQLCRHSGGVEAGLGFAHRGRRSQSQPRELLHRKTEAGGNTGEVEPLGLSSPGQERGQVPDVIAELAGITEPGGVGEAVEGRSVVR